MRIGSAAAFTVYEQQPEEVTALAAQLLPVAALAPAAVLDRLLADAVLHSGQVRWALTPRNGRAVVDTVLWSEAAEYKQSST